jgi:glucosylceramidase
MKKNILILVLLACNLVSESVFSQNTVSWVSTSESQQWIKQRSPKLGKASDKIDVEIRLDKPQQKIEGFGACFDELGWTSLNVLPTNDRESIIKEFFAPNIGANFTICRMPVGANDFSRNWYSYNETEGDFEMKNFSIKNDFETLIPFIKNAQKYNPALKLWASPWSPPTWMKYNKHYASRPVPDVSKWPADRLQKMRDSWGMDFRGISNGMKPEQTIKEGHDGFIQEDKYFKAYSLYFSKFIDAYKKEGIKIGMVLPQNEFNSDQVFPSCTWKASSLANFVSYLGPEIQEKNIDVFFGTMERPNYKLVDTLLTDPRSKSYIKGVGFQWAGKDAIGAIHKNYPNLNLYQSEQECGNGYNDWKGAVHSLDLMKHFLNNGVTAYMYWNMSLNEGGVSSWGWHQNSLVVVDTLTKKYRYSHEYYLLKHLSHFVKPNAQKVETEGAFDNIIAFENPDKSIAILVYNDSSEQKNINIKIGGKTINPSLKPNTFNTFLIK